MNFNKLTTFYKPENNESSDDKLKVINEQIENFGVYLHYAETSKFKNSFFLPKYKTYNDIIIKSYDDFKKIFNYKNITKFNYTEHLFLNESRIFFDIDYTNDNEENKQELDKLIKAINWIMDTFKLRIYGFCEIKDETFEEYLNTYWEDVLILTNKNLTKCLSAHLSLNGYSKRSDIEKFMKQYISSKFELTNNLFDTSVYKTTKQALRCSFSPKVSSNKITYEKFKEIKENENQKVKYNETKNEYELLKIRRIPDDEVKEILNHPEIFYNIRMAPLSTDKYIDLSMYLQDNKPIQKDQKQIKTYTESKQNDISIFQYIKVDDKIINVEDIYENTNYYDFGRYLYPYIQTVLNPEEIINEIMKISINQEIQDKHNDFIPVDEWLDKVIYSLNDKIKQNYKNIKNIYSLIKYNNDIIEQNKENNKLVSECIKRKNILLTYISKYEKYNFLSNDFYDFTDLKYSSLNKIDKIKNNCCFVGDKIYNVFEGYYYENTTSFKRKFKISGESFQELEKELIYFNDHEELKRIKAEIDIFKLSKQERKEYNQTLKNFINILNTTFKYNDDFKFYLSFFSKKLIEKSTINKGIINQGTEQEPAQDSFKTYFNDLLNPYIKSSPCNYQNFNKPLNGSYLKGKLCIIEELPKDIKDASDFINRLKGYSETDIIRIEEKGLNSYNKDNELDFIINTNHTVRKIFSNKNDCEALLKRFRILTRQSVNWTDETKETITKISKNKRIFGYLLKEYLINEVKGDYFEEHFKDSNDISLTYKELSVPDSETNKVSNSYSIDEYIEHFKSEFLTTTNKIKITALYNELITDKAVEKIKTKGLKQCLIALLQENKRNDLITVSNDKNKDIIIKTEKLNQTITLIYNQYYESKEESKEE